jgi:hypothetical protein
MAAHHCRLVDHKRVRQAIADAGVPKKQFFFPTLIRRTPVTVVFSYAFS